ncbi:PREDICTED: tumor necrosis factor alpha-induced protein 3-like [Amphimedon queenslandica]|uniref:ubiquitinyl hydrolase 1 n=1 Tax=Amphimedon queenslandica TaxID=400682 RepID=A0A1X7VIR6_AMPQE|nr:PREDICTED: tumor necrosis factor alpha-induced protein 3-like [Amphimedon queenslandica]|eukprot:XP_011410093.1 PREDICTED: tumor necrosis factor alpha-induced protein 3-like [Amphimedon queenslandica]
MSLPRSISSADLRRTERCQDFIRKDWKNAEGPDAPVNYFNASPRFTLTIPSLIEHKDEKFRRFVFERVINYTIKEDLERSKTINWCRGASEVVPLYTTGDGNCLLHAASLGMWGFQDRNFTLRKSIHNALENGKYNGLYDRWIDWRRSENRKIGFSLDPHQWEKEWADEVKFSSTEKVNHGSLGYLNEFHVFVLSNVLRRPVFLYSPPKLFSQDEGVTLQMVEFYGLYLPLLWNPRHCIKDPLPIVYNNGHFSALTIIDDRKEYTDGCLLFPLCDFYFRDLPIRFINERENATLLKEEYLRIKVLHSTRRDIHCAKLILDDQPKYMKPLLEGFIMCCLEAYQKNAPNDERLGSSSGGTCRNKCGFNGSSQYNGYCSQCFKRESASNPYQGASSPYQKPPDPYQRERGQEPMNPRDEMEVSSVTCNNNCNRLGFAMYLGMCKDCYERKRGKDKESDRPVSQPPPQSQAKPPISQITSSLLEKSSETRACRTKGCDFFGKAATKFYCSQCFEKNLPKILSSSDLSLSPDPHNPNNPRPGSASNFEPPRDPKEEGEGPKCSNCRKFFANPEYGDLCSACFKDKTKKEANNKTAPLQQSDPPYQQNVHRTTAPQERRENWRGRDEDEARLYPREDQRRYRYEGERERDHDRHRRDDFPPDQRERERYYNREERDRRAGNEYYNDYPPREGYERERNSGERMRVQSRERNEGNSGERSPAIYSKERQYSGEGRRPLSGERNRPYREYNQSGGRRDEGHLNELNGGRRDQYYHHEKEREKTRMSEGLVCILCDLSAPISKMNGICEEHARKCRREQDEVEQHKDLRFPEKRLCKSPGCGYFPDPSCDNYCQRCHEENQRKYYNKRTKCSLDGCSNDKTHDNGLCDRCYKERYPDYKEKYSTDSPQYGATGHPLAPSSQFEGTERNDGHSHCIRRSSEPQLAQYNRSPSSNFEPKLSRLRSLSQEDERETERESERRRAEYSRSRFEEEEYRRREHDAERRANNYYDRDRDRQNKQLDLI